MSARFATANPHRIKAAHRRRRKVASGQSVQRYYDPGIGRFLSVDPVSADGSTGGNFNRYWYAANNSYRFTDPDGRICTGSRIEDGNGNCASTGGPTTQSISAHSTVPAAPGSRNSSSSASTAQSPQSTWRQIQRGFEKIFCSGACVWSEPLRALEVIPGEGAGFKAVGGLFVITKAINLPGWGKLSVNMAHIAEGHMVGGALTSGRTVFVGLNQQGVMAAIRQAYGSASVVRTKGDRALLLGTTKTGMQVEMWLNKATNVIETAYPVVGR